MEHIEILGLGDGWLNVYKQKNGAFTAMYSFKPGSNSSEVLRRYFDKFKELSKDVTPSGTWDINKN